MFRNELVALVGRVVVEEVVAVVGEPVLKWQPRPG